MHCEADQNRLIAIMLGRLQMSIDDCIKAYSNLSVSVFRKENHRVGWKGNLQGRFGSVELERAIKDIVVSQGLDKDGLMMDDENAKCKVYVAILSNHCSSV